MKKIIAFLLMLSMVFSLVACSTEPVSDVVNNDNADVSGEVSEEVDVSNVDTTNLSIFGMDKEDLSEEQLNTYNTLINTLWISTFMQKEGMESSVDYFGTTLNFEEDGTVIMVEDGTTKNGTWTSEWQNFEHDGRHYNRASIDISFDSELFSMFIEPNEYKNVIFLNDKINIWFNNSEDVEIPQEPQEVIAYDYTLADTVWELIEVWHEAGGRAGFSTPVAFEFISATEAKIIQGSNEYGVTLEFDATSISISASDFYSVGYIETEFTMTSEFFANNTDGNNDTVKAKIVGDRLDVIIGGLRYDFNYDGTKIKSPITEDITLYSYVLYDYDEKFYQGDMGYMPANFANGYELLLKVDGSAEFSYDSDIISGTWSYDNIILGGSIDPYQLDFTVSSEILDFENNTEFFAPMMKEIEERSDDFAITQDNADSFNGEFFDEGAIIRTDYNGFVFMGSGFVID